MHKGKAIEETVAGGAVVEVQHGFNRFNIVTFRGKLPARNPSMAASTLKLNPQSIIFPRTLSTQVSGQSAPAGWRDRHDGRRLAIVS